MPDWLVEFFGSKELNRLFWLVCASTSPFWILMLFFPRAKATRVMCSPWLGPAILGIVYLYLLYQAATITRIPPIEGVEMPKVRRFWSSPLLFIAFWMHKTAGDLFIGSIIFREAYRRRWNVPVELLLCWILGPVGILAFSIRLWIFSRQRHQRR